MDNVQNLNAPVTTETLNQMGKEIEAGKLEKATAQANVTTYTGQLQEQNNLLIAKGINPENAGAWLEAKRTEITGMVEKIKTLMAAPLPATTVSSAQNNVSGS